jgi:uncharacterized protein (TIGR02597 family)
MKPQFLLHLVPLALGLSLTGAFAQSAISPAIGFNKVTCNGNSDTLISVPFHQKPEFVGVSSATPEDTTGGSIDPGEDIVLTVGSAAFGSLVGTHYIRFTGGAKNGFSYDVSGNTGTSITVDGMGDDLSGVLATDPFKIVPHWTFATLFPSGAGVHASASEFIRQTEILVLDQVSLGINKSAVAVFFYLGSAGEWRQVGGGAVSKDSQVVLPHQAFIVRHNNNAASTQFCPSGRVPSGQHAIQVDIGTVKNDVFLSLDRPIDVSLDESGLVASGAFTSSGSEFIRADELLVFDNTATGINKSAVAVYFHLASANQWRKVGGGNGDAGADMVFTAGNAVVLRKSQAGAAGTTFVVNSPSY